jgi:hypothetical protein
MLVVMAHALMHAKVPCTLQVGIKATHLLAFFVMILA